MTDCVYYKGSLNGFGYANTVLNGKKTKAARALWIKTYGPIADGLVVDHLCHTEAVSRDECEGGVVCKHRACINIDHLRLITQRENILAGRHNIDNRSHCNQGHPFIKENIMIRKNGKRECAECNRVRARANWANRKVSA